MEAHPSLNKETVQPQEGINILEVIDKYLVHWKWFVLSVAITLFGAMMYLRYAIPMYKASTTIMVKDDRKGGIQSELTAFEDLGLSKGIKNNVDNEVEILKSTTIMANAVTELNLNIGYFTEGRIKTVELYRDKPIVVSVFDAKPNYYKKGISYRFKINSADEFEVYTSDGNLMKKSAYGKLLELDYCSVVVLKSTNNSKKTSDYDINVVFTRMRDVTQKYKNALVIAPVGKNTSIIELTMTDPVKEKAEDILNTVVEIYNNEAIADKNLISQNTEKFIEERIKLISNELGDVEKKKEGFMETNQITDVGSQAELYVQNAVLYEKQLIDTETQIAIVQSMIDFMKTIEIDQLVPINVIPLEGNTSTLINEHNALVLTRNRLLPSASLKNPRIIDMDNNIREYIENIKVSLKTQLSSLNIRKRDLEVQNSKLSGKISQVPGQTRRFRGIERQQQIKETLYLYLLQKREEIAMALAVTPPNAKVIDSASAMEAPVSPKNNIIYLGAFVLGLLIPVSIIFADDFLDTKIKNRNDVESIVSVPFLGDIPKSETSDEIINTNSRSSSAEAIRIVRTNLEFLLGSVPAGRAKTIFVTSTLPKEGKTFVAVNLATTIALSNQKVLLIGLDIRNPKIDQYVNIPGAGLTNYIAQKEGNVHDYIVKLDGYENLHVLPSGVIPPNPVELLLNQQVDRMFDQLKLEYEYIIVDTAPVSVVTDTLLIAKHADAFIYVMRANYLDKRLLKLAESFYREKKLPNMSIVLNDTIWKKSSRYGYGYGYGYGYAADVEKKPWYKEIFSKKN